MKRDELAEFANRPPNCHVPTFDPFPAGFIYVSIMPMMG